MDEREMLSEHQIAALWETITGARFSPGSKAEEFARAIEREILATRHTTPDREAIIEECAKVAERTYARDGFNFELGTAAATYIRALKTASTISPRDTLIEEIAEMVDHMGEGRRLEEYVGAIREMKSGDKGGA
ncbi:TPA: hypothetical protein QDB19_004105 [Burkholderia vietnamiensis]|nr:hypothetical protein [Burkholderia vietnamiensis]